MIQYSSILAEQSRWNKLFMVWSVICKWTRTQKSSSTAFGNRIKLIPILLFFSCNSEMDHWSVCVKYFTFVCRLFSSEKWLASLFFQHRISSKLIKYFLQAGDCPLEQKNYPCDFSNSCARAQISLRSKSVRNLCSATLNNWEEKYGRNKAKPSF